MKGVGIMKQYRCPHCGAKTFSKMKLNNNKLYGASRGMALRCSICNQKSTYRSIGLDKAVLALAIAAIGSALLVLLKEYGVIVQICVALASLGCPILLICFTQRDKPLMPCDSDTHKLLYFESNTKVSVNSSKYIKPYGVYGLKFKSEMDDEKFKQAFSDGMVPAVFHPNQKGSLTYDVRIINKSAVPKELLEIGSKILVEDADGIFIAKGTIENSELDH